MFVVPSDLPGFIKFIADSAPNGGLVRQPDQERRVGWLRTDAALSKAAVKKTATSGQVRSKPGETITFHHCFGGGRLGGRSGDVIIDGEVPSPALRATFPRTRGEVKGGGR